MATYTWNGSVDQALNTGNNWTGPWPGTTGATDVFVFSGTPTRAPATTTGFSVPAMRVASSYTLGAITLTMTGNLGLNGQNTVDGTHSVYIEDGEIFWANSATQIVVGATNNVPVYVGNNAEFRLGSYLGNNTNRIIKYGPGKLYFVYGTTPASVGNIGKGLTINEGSFVLRGADYSACTPGNVLGANGSVVFGGGSATWEVENPSSAVSKTFANPLSLSSGGTFKLGANATLVFSTNPSSVGGTLTLSGAGTLQFSVARTWSSNIVFSSTGTLTLPAGSNLGGNISSVGTGATGTLSIAGSTIGIGTGIQDGSAFNGNIGGDCTISGGVITMAGNFQGAVSVTTGLNTLTGASNGYIASLGAAELTLTAAFSGGASGTTAVGGAGYAAKLHFKGNGAFNATRTISLSQTSSILLYEAASISSPVTATTDTTNATLNVEDGTVCTYSGALSTNQGANLFKIGSKGTLVLSSGTAASGVAGRTFALNSDPGYTGTIKITGAGFSGASPITLTRGTLHLNRAVAIGLGSAAAGLTVFSGALVACSSAGAYAAQITGALTLNSGAIMQFGAP